MGAAPPADESDVRRPVWEWRIDVYRALLGKPGGRAEGGRLQRAARRRAAPLRGERAERGGGRGLAEAAGRERRAAGGRWPGCSGWHEIVVGPSGLEALRRRLPW